MIGRYNKVNIAQIMVESVLPHLVDQYGIVDVATVPQEGGNEVVRGIVEKPKIADAPSNLSVVGRYVLPNKIMNILEHTSKVRVMKFN